jgi:uncharacterized protein (TIGR02246 family)
MGRKIALAALTLAICLSPAAAQTASTSDENIAPKIEQFLAKYVDTYNQHDPAALAALYTADAVLVGPSGTPVTGRNAIEASLTTMFKQMGSPTLAANATEIHALGGDAWAVGQSTIKNSGQTGPAEVRGHWAAIYAPEGGEWKVRMLTVGSNAPAPQAVSGSSNK